MNTELNFKTYLVGGAVRDEILGIKPKDKDYVVVGANQEDLLAHGFRCVGNDFPVFLHPLTNEEWALARTERKTAIGTKGFDFNTGSHITIEDDLFRRDLTINAIAKDMESGSYIDPYSGIKDIQNKKLRHVSLAFKEDPLRVLRVARLYARYKHLGFSIAKETILLMTEMSNSGELQSLTPERVWKETQSALSTNNPESFFECLKDVGALRIIMPELDNLWGVPQPKIHHPEIDCGKHTMMALKISVELTNNPIIRFGVLLHDVGKATTAKKVLPNHYMHEKNGIPLIDNLCKRLKVPKEYRLFAIDFCKYHTFIHNLTKTKPRSILRMLYKINALRNPKRNVWFALAAEADARGRLGYENARYNQGDCLINIGKQLSFIDNSKFDYATNKGKIEAENHKAEIISRVVSMYS